MEIGEFSVFVAFRYARFYITLLSPLFFFFSKNIGKRPAVEPFVFWENRRTLKKKRLLCVRLRFFICSYFCWFSGTPCRRPGRDSLHFGSILVRFVDQLSRAFRRPRRTPAETSQETSQETCRELSRNLCKELSQKRNLKRRIPFFDATATATNLQL